MKGDRVFCLFSELLTFLSWSTSKRAILRMGDFLGNLEDRSYIKMRISHFHCLYKKGQHNYVQLISFSLLSAQGQDY